MSNAADRILSAMDSRAAGANTVSELSYGTVTSVNPLVITRDGGAALTAGFLELSITCKPFSITNAMHSHELPDNPELTSIELQQLQIWPGLSIGEKVIMMSFNNSQKFFIERM